METINQRIRELRKKLGYTQEYVAKQVGEKLSTYSQMERKGNITCEMLIKLTDVLDTDALTLLYGEQYNEKIIIIESIDSSEIQPLVTQNIYEKIAVIAMRAFPFKRKQEIYEYIIDQLKSI